MLWLNDLRIRSILSAGLFVAMVAAFVAFDTRYSDNPYHACGTAFCGKGGVAHSAAFYHSFQLWQPIFFGGWFVAFGLLFWLVRSLNDVGDDG